MELLPEHVSKTAELHISDISTDFISSLGTDFVMALYEAIARSQTSVGSGAQKNEETPGFVAFTSGLTKLYRSIVSEGLHDNAWRFRNEK